MGEPLCIVRGSINHDEYFHVNHISRPGETIASSGHASRVGGKGANQAVAVARAGGSVRFYGAIGRDGEWIRTRMADEGVGVQDILVVEEVTGRAIIQVDEQGENSIILFAGANYSDAHERAFAAKEAGWFPEATVILLQNEIDAHSTLYAIEHARPGAQVIINPSPLPSRDEIRAFPWSKIAWLVVNADEARGLYSALVEDASLESDSADAREVLARLTKQDKLKATGIVCTLGGEGVLAAVVGPTGGERTVVHVHAAPLRGEVRDTTGAGDCFTGYFVQGIMEAHKAGRAVSAAEMERILGTCVVAAGMCCEKRGTIDSIPMREEVMSRLTVL